MEKIILKKRNTNDNTNAPMGLVVDFKEINEIFIDYPEARRIFKKNLELIMVVDNHYSHIEQLDTLVATFGAIKSDEHPPFQFLSKQMFLLAENTRRNHYRSEDEKFTDVYDAYLEFFGSNIEIFKFKL